MRRIEVWIDLPDNTPTLHIEWVRQEAENACWAIIGGSAAPHPARVQANEVWPDGARVVCDNYMGGLE